MESPSTTHPAHCLIHLNLDASLFERATSVVTSGARRVDLSASISPAVNRATRLGFSVFDASETGRYTVEEGARTLRAGGNSGNRLAAAGAALGRTRI